MMKNTILLIMLVMVSIFSCQEGTEQSSQMARPDVVEFTEGVKPFFERREDIVRELYLGEPEDLRASLSFDTYHQDFLERYRQSLYASKVLTDELVGQTGIEHLRSIKDSVLMANGVPLSYIEVTRELHNYVAANKPDLQFLEEQTDH